MPRSPPSSPSQELIPRIANSFNTRALTRNDSFTILTAYKSTAGGIDAKLSTKLNKSVTTVGRRVDAARTSFSSVTKAINDPKLDICKDVALLKEWDGIEKDFMSTLSNSKKVAAGGATLIEDFLSTIVPYLLGDGQLQQKQGEMREYRKTLESGSGRAEIFANNLMGISERLGKFAGRWAEHSEEAVRKLHIELGNLQKDVAEVSKSVEKTKTSFTSLAAQRAMLSDKEIPKGEIKQTLKGSIKDVVSAVKKQDKSQKEVSKETATIRDKSDELAIVWNLMVDDINVIESQLGICENGNSSEVFNQRVGKLSAQYIPLMGALRKYAMALSSLDDPVPGTPFWRKLIGQ